MMLADVRAHVREAQISIDAALAAAEAVAAHGIVPSRDFENVVEQLRLASEALDRIDLSEGGKIVELPKAVRL